MNAAIVAIGERPVVGSVKASRSPSPSSHASSLRIFSSASRVRSQGYRNTGLETPLGV